MKKFLALLLLVCMLPVSAFAADYLAAKVVPVPLDLYYQGLLLHCEAFTNVGFSQYHAPYLYNDRTGEIRDVKLTEEDEEVLRGMEPQGGYPAGFDKLAEDEGFVNAWFQVAHPRYYSFDYADGQALLTMMECSLLIDTETAKARIVENAVGLTDNGQLICWNASDNPNRFTVGAEEVILPENGPKTMKAFEVKENGYAALMDAGCRQEGGFVFESVLVIGRDGQTHTVPVGEFKMGQQPDSLKATQDGALLWNRNNVFRQPPVLVRGEEVLGLVWDGTVMSGAALDEAPAVAIPFWPMGVSRDGRYAAFMDADDRMIMMDLTTLETAVVLTGEEVKEMGFNHRLMQSFLWDGADYASYVGDYRLKIIAP